MEYVDNPRFILSPQSGTKVFSWGACVYLSPRKELLWSILEEVCFKGMRVDNLSMITKKQKLVLDYIRSFAQAKGYAPSLEEIRRHFRLASPSTAHHHMHKLEKLGYLTREANHPRSISLQPSQFMELKPSSILSMSKSISLPILGRANCGEALIIAEENPEGYLSVSTRILNRKDGVFVLRADGDSMNRANVYGKNIEHGDFLVIDSQQENPKNGDYVLSIIDGCANIKKFTKDPKTDQVVLMPESSNESHKPIYLSSEDDFTVRGKVIAVMKK